MTDNIRHFDNIRTSHYIDISNQVRALAREALEQEKNSMNIDNSFPHHTWWCAKINAYNHVLVDILGEKPEE